MVAPPRASSSARLMIAARCSGVRPRHRAHDPERADPLRMSHGERGRDHAAEREADERRPVDRLRVEQRGEIGHVVVEGVRSWRLPRLCVAAKVVAEQGELVPEGRDDAVPRLKMGAHPVKQRDVTASPLDGAIDRHAVARRDHRVGAGVDVKCGITSRPKSVSDRIAMSRGRPKLAP
jgi:hypothetical protein